ncbi:MAG: hypothetical protein ACKO37_02190, partial [Vampirovibrionales bacterium]
MMQHPDVRQGLLRQLEVGTPILEKHPTMTRRYTIQKPPVSGEEAVVYFLKEAQGQRPLAPRVLKVYPKGQDPNLIEKGRRELALKAQFPDYVLPHSSYAGHRQANGT